MKEFEENDTNRFKILEAIRGLTEKLVTGDSWNNWKRLRKQYASTLGSESSYLNELERLREKFIELGAPIKDKRGNDLVFVAQSRDANAQPGKQHRIIIDEQILDNLNPDKLKSLLKEAWKTAYRNSLTNQKRTQYIWEGKANAYKNALYALGVEINAQTENDLFSDSNDVPSFTEPEPQEEPKKINPAAVRVTTELTPLVVSSEPIKKEPTSNALVSQDYQNLIKYVRLAVPRINQRLRALPIDEANQLEQAILDRDFKNPIFLSANYEVCAFSLFQQEKITFNSFMTLLILNLAIQDAQDKYQFDFSDSETFQSELYSKFSGTFKDYNAFFTPGCVNNSEAIFQNPVKNASSASDKVLAALILKVPFSDLDRNCERLGTWVPVVRFSGDHLIVPSYSVILEFYSRFDLNYVAPMPVFGKIGEQTLAELNRDNKHPVSMFSTLIKNNYENVHSSITKKLYIFIHDLFHVTAKNCIGKNAWNKLIRELIPALESPTITEEIDPDSAEAKGIELLISALHDFNYSSYDNAITSRYDQKKREDLFEDFLQKLFVRSVSSSIPSEIGMRIRFDVTYPGGTTKSYGRKDARKLVVDLSSESISIQVSDEPHKREQRKLEILRNKQRKSQFDEMTGQQKYNCLVQQGVIKIKEQVCIVDTQALQDLPIRSVVNTKAFSEIFQYITALTNPVSSIEVALGNVSLSLKHQDTAKELIEALSRAPNITSLNISCGTLARKLNFTSSFSTRAAKALAQHGMHLVNIVVSANTKGAEEFAQSILTLAEKGKLQTYQLAPISSEGWSSGHRINSFLADANTAIKKKTATLIEATKDALAETQIKSPNLETDEFQDPPPIKLLVFHQ